MANASGRAVDGLIPGDFRHAASGVHYRVFEDGGRVWLSYQRAAEPDGERLEGRRELRYFIGSGMRGRTYLFEQEGYWFESPVNWYGKKRVWDMAPNFQTDREMPLTLPVDPGCLRCHASGVASTLPDARNHYSGEPFAQGGVTCAACHGDGTAHITSGGKTRMLDIDRLAPVRRDSVCLSCHLEGQVTVMRQGRRLEEFVPGEDLFDFALFYVYKNEVGSGGRATSQWEALAESRCKKESGDRLTCTTCHDPHGSPAPEQRVSYYRGKCLGCHGQGGFAASHHPENPDCTQCHMARTPSNDIAHEQVTDHFIKKRVSATRLPVVNTGELEAVGIGKGDREEILDGPRDLGLAYAQMAERGDKAAGRRAMELLRRAEATEKSAPKDAELHGQLGFLEQVSGETDEAAAEYRHALGADPHDSLALGNLALIEAQRHHQAEAILLWREVFDHDPVQLGAGMNLAVTECQMGDRAGALNTLGRVLSFAPDAGKARQMEAAIRSGKLGCAAR
jgi:predicted CXXCH cytochrome family protein